MLLEEADQPRPAVRSKMSDLDAGLLLFRCRPTNQALPGQELAVSLEVQRELDRAFVQASGRLNAKPFAAESKSFSFFPFQGGGEAREPGFDLHFRRRAGRVAPQFGW